MSKNKPPKFHCKSEAQKRAIRASYARKAAEEKSYVGKVYRGETKYIDTEPKKQRNYVVVKSRGKNVTVAKLKSIKQFDANGKNADPALVEINHERYNLPNRTGVDFQRFDRNRMSGNPLNIEDTDVFPEGKEEFTLGSHDTARAIRHTKPKKKE